jgi:uncharacterized protein (TIGR02145 family)
MLNYIFHRKFYNPFFIIIVVIIQQNSFFRDDYINKFRVKTNRGYHKAFKMKRLSFFFIATLFAGIAAAGGSSSGTFTDKRDGKTYRTVVIGGKMWMRENLNYETGESWCYDKTEFNCGRYGRLYDWKTAMKACPSGWHLPSNQEWDSLVGAAGGKTVAGKKLKSTSGWNSNGNGIDDYGFSALPGGSRGSDGYFYNVGTYGYWWAATENTAFNAYYRRMSYNGDYAYSDYLNKSYAWSVRCVGD